MVRTTRTLLLLFLALGVSACGETTSPTAVGEVHGIVTVDGAGLPNVTVELSGAESRQTTTDSDGAYGFTHVVPGAYVVSIRDAPDDASFSAVSKTAVIRRETGREVEIVDFEGHFIRTSTVSGTVRSGNRGLGGVQVRLEGPDTLTTVTASDGVYSASGLRRGSYRVEITGFPSSIRFPNTVGEVEVPVGGAATLDFEGAPELTATVVISDITRRTSGGDVESVAPDDLRGRIDVRVGVNRGDDTPDAVELLLGGEVVGRQLFNVDGAPPAAPERTAWSGAAVSDVPSEASFELSFSIDTGAFDPESGTPRFTNGGYDLTARLSTKEGGVGVWTSTVPVTLRNTDTFVGTLEAERGPVAGDDGREWVGGDVGVRVLPVIYNPGRAITSITVELRREAGAALRERASGGTAPFQVIFPGEGQPMGSNVAGYQTPRGETDVFRVRSARYGDGSMVEAPPTQIVDNVRIDNVPPPGGRFELPDQGEAADCCRNNWVGAGFVFAEAFEGEPDEGVGGGTVTIHVGGADLTDQEVAAMPAVVVGSDLSQTATNTELRAVASYRDALGNRRLVPLSPSPGNPLSNTRGAVFGVDLTPPSVRFSQGALAERAVNPGSGASWLVRAEDPLSGLASAPARTVVRLLRPELDGAASCPFPGTPSCHPSPDGLERELPGSGEGYFSYRTTVVDRAGNRSTELRRNALRDLTPPTVDEVFAPPTAAAGGTVEVEVSGSDNVDLHRAELLLRFGSGEGLPSVALPFAPADTLGEPFDGNPVGVATARWNAPVVASLERADSGLAMTSPSGAIRNLSGVRGIVEDAARNHATADRGLEGTGAGVPASFSVEARGAEGGVSTWAMEAGGSMVCARNTALPGGGTCLEAPGSVLLEAIASGASGVFVAPFATVHFIAMVEGRTRWLGATSLATLVADQAGETGRRWSWSLNWVPEADFPSGAHEFVAIGVDDGGRALKTRWVGGLTVVSAN
jgi:hypothetical protein